MSPELIAILAVGVALGSLTVGLVLWIDRRIDRVGTRMDRLETRLETRMDRLETRLESRIDGYIAEAGNDRRAFQAAMDDFRREMQRLAERQSHVEGLRAAE